MPFLLPLAFAAGAALAEPEPASPSDARGDIHDIRGFMPMDGLPHRLQMASTKGPGLKILNQCLRQAARAM